jgi:hypothetical protein
MDAYIYTFVTPYVNDHNYGDEINYACSSHTSMWFLENLMMSVPSKCFFLWIPNYWFHVCFWILVLRLQMALASCIARFIYSLSSFKCLYLKTYFSNVCSHNIKHTHIVPMTTYMCCIMAKNEESTSNMEPWWGWKNKLM